MASSPFACNQKNSFGSKLNKAKESKKTPEAVVLIADKSQVITAIIPFNTPNAATIRQHMHANVLEDGQKIFIYRSMNGWTNISLEATEAAPKLTCDPITTPKTAWREFNKCAAVSTVTIKWKGSDNEYGYDDIAGMETEFDPLPEPSDANEEPSSSKTDAEIIYDHIDAINKRMDGLENNMTDTLTKLTYVVNGVDKMLSAASENGKPNEPFTEPAPSTPAEKRQRNK